MKILRRTTCQITGIISLSAAMFFFDGGQNLMSQELKFPTRWENDFQDVRSLYRNDTVTIRFLGDVMMHQRQIDNAIKEDGTYDFDSYFRYIRDDLKSADIAVVNMEFTLGGEPHTGYPAFSAPDGIAHYMADCGIDVFLTANNHIFDKGKSGAGRTLDIYRNLSQSHGVSFTGLAADEKEREWNHPLVRMARGIRFAFVNMTYLTNGGRREGWPKVCYLDDEQDISLAMEDAERKGADIVIALPHWGEEYELLPSEAQKQKAEFLVRSGADLIIGAHPHVIQPIWMTGNVQTAFSLGNAVSNMSAKNTRLELMITARIVREADGDIRILKLEPQFLWCSLPWHFAERYTVLPVRKFIGKRDLWINKADYDNMVTTYERVKNITGIEDKEDEQR